MTPTASTTMPLRHILSLALSNRDQLSIEYTTSTGDLRAYVLPLNRKLGNHEGQFHIGGINFSRSAQDIRLSENILHAKLSSSQKDLWHDEIAIDVKIENDARGGEVPVIRFRRVEDLWRERWRNIRVVGGILLVAEYREKNGAWKEVFFLLEKVLGIREGVFDRHGSGFSSRVNDARIVGTELVAEHKKTGRRITVELSKILRLGDGVVVPRRDMKNEDLEHEVMVDGGWGREWLPNARNIRLLNYRRERRWYLIAECLTSYGSFEESVIKVHEIIGPHDGEMFSHPSFAQTEIPEHARNTRLEDGVLTASFDKGSGEWVERRVDLAQLVACEGGALTLRQFGSECPGCSQLFYAGAFHTPWRGSRILLAPSGPGYRTPYCTFCRLIQDTIKEYAPVCSSYEVWIMTWWEKDTGAWESSPKKKDVTLVIRAKGVQDSTRKALYNMLRGRERRIPATVEIRCTILLEAGSSGDKDKRKEKELCDPQRYRTIIRNTKDRCWLEPHLRWPTIRGWIETCATEHNDCRRKDVPQLPTRYLDIGQSDRDPVRLVVSNGEHGSYACLSHCWGGKNICTLTERTKSEFTKKIPKHILPQVFIDAIEVCRKLGLRRIWIDSLAIQQDSTEDWQYESQRMGSYYSNCTLCIAATSSASSMESFQIAERPTAVRSSGVDAESGPFDLIAYPTNLTEERPHFSQSHDLESLLQNFPLLTRAWVFQERWLAPRVLHFCGSEVVFECAQMTTCECGQARLSLSETQEPKDIKRINVRTTTTSQDGLVTRRKQLAALPWDLIVTTYSSLNLTYHTDRLLAISGVASTLYETRNKDHEKNESGNRTLPLYLAGLWRMDLARDISWFVGPTLITVKDRNENEAVGSGIVRKSKPTKYLAPSWSWASVLDPVRYLDMRHVEPLFTLLNVHISYATENRFGSVKEGCSLHVKGKIIESSWELRSSVDDTTSSIFWLSDIVGTQQLSKTDERGVMFSPDYAIAKPGPKEIHPTIKLYVFPLATIGIGYSRWATNDAKVIDKARSTICLVLKEAEGIDGERFVYERVGFTEYSSFREEVRNFDGNEYREQELFIV